MKVNNLVPLCFMLLLSTQALSQNNYFTKLELKEKETFIVGPTNMLLVDTLIMHDKATIKFSPEAAGILQVNVAYIGNKCTIESKGSNGTDADKKHLGSPGQNGGDLIINIHLNEVESLTIDTRGGRGGNGLQGKNGASGQDSRQEEKVVRGADGKENRVVVVIPPVEGSNGTNATSGHKGGNGGNIELTYSTKNFIPSFNNSRGLNKIFILTAAGNYGKDGVPGSGGIGKMDGKLIQVSNEESADGQVKLVNVNGLSVQE